MAFRNDNNSRSPVSYVDLPVLNRNYGAKEMAGHVDRVDERISGYKPIRRSGWIQLTHGWFYYNYFSYIGCSDFKRRNSTMAEILFFKGLKLSVDIICFFAAGIALINEILRYKLAEWIELNDFQNTTMLTASTAFLCLRIVWFLYDKLYKERKEKKERMKMEKELFEEMLKKGSESKLTQNNIKPE